MTEKVKSGNETEQTHTCGSIVAATHVADGVIKAENRVLLQVGVMVVRILGEKGDSMFCKMSKGTQMKITKQARFFFSLSFYWDCQNADLMSESILHISRFLKEPLL